MNKKSLLLKILGLVLIIIPLCINRYSIFRLLSSLLGIIFLTVGILNRKKHYKLQIILYSILLLLLLYGIDYACTYFLKRIPIFSYEVISSNTVSTYDSILYRVYNCNGEYMFDSFYQKNYVCAGDVPIEEINSFLSNISSNYEKYHYKFVTVKGKVSEVFGNEYLTLQPYEQKDTNLIGQITFLKDASLVIANKDKDINLYEKYEIYDNVIVTGRIIKLETNNKIVMRDAIIISTDNFDAFTINVVENKSCEKDIKKIAQTSDYTYYSSCLNSMYVKYNEENIYDLKFALESKKMTGEKLISNGEKLESNHAILYAFETYNIVKCIDKNAMIIGNKMLTLESNYCENIQNVQENEEESI